MIDEIEAKQRICPRYKSAFISHHGQDYYNALSSGNSSKLILCDGTACFEWEICLAYRTTAIKKLHKEGICTIGYPGCIEDCDGYICIRLLEDV